MKKELSKDPPPKKDKTSAIEKRLQKMEIRFDSGEEFVVVDMGSGSIKVGFSGEDLPRIVMPTCIGEKTIEEMGVGNELKRKTVYKYGNEAFANQKEEMNKDGYDLYYPVKRGIIVDTDKAQHMLQNIFDQMGLDTKSINVLMTDSPFSTKKNKQDIAELMFE